MSYTMLSVSSAVSLVYVEKTHVIYSLYSTFWDRGDVAGSIEQFIGEVRLPEMQLCWISTDTKGILAFIVPSELLPLYKLMFSDRCVVSRLNEYKISSEFELMDALCQRFG